jgi:hypothetical protein
LHDYLQRLDEDDAEEAPTANTRTKNLVEKIEALRQERARYGAILDQFERTGESQISLTDPDSRAMAAHIKVGVGYNVQIAVDAKHKLIAEQAVTNDVLAYQIKIQTKRAFGRPINPHLFRDCAATSIAIHDLEHVRIATSILGHTCVSTLQSGTDADRCPRAQA